MKKQKSSRSRLRKVSLNVYAEPEQVVTLRKLCRVNGLTQQKLLREGLDLVLAKHLKERS